MAGFIGELTVRELTKREIDTMPPATYAWHCQNNGKNVDKALNAKKLQEEEEHNQKTKYWENVVTGRVSPEFLKSAEDNSKSFRDNHPQIYHANTGNQAAFVMWLKNRNLLVTEANLREAFVDLTKTGKLVLNPAAIGIIRIRISNGQILDMHESDLPVWQQRNKEPNVEILPFEEITGRELVCSSQLNWFLRVYPEGSLEAIKRAKMTATEYQKKVVQPNFINDPDRVRSVIEEFKRTHPDYPLNEDSCEHMVSYMDKRKKVYTVANLEEAYRVLVAEGYIEPNKEYVNRVVAEVRKETWGMSADEYNRWLLIPGNTKRANFTAVA